MFDKLPLAAVLSGLVLTVGVGSSVYRMQVNEQKSDCIEQRSAGARASTCFDGARQTQEDLAEARDPLVIAERQATTTITDAKDKVDAELVKAFTETIPGLQRLATESADTALTEALGRLISTLTAGRAAAQDQFDAAIAAVTTSPGMIDAKVAETRGRITTQFQSIAEQVDGAFVSSLAAVTEAQTRLDDVKAALETARADMARTFAGAMAAVNGAFDNLPSASQTATDAGNTTGTAPSTAEGHVTDAKTNADGTVGAVSSTAGQAVTDAQSEVTSQINQQVTDVQDTAGLDVTSDPSGVGVTVSPSGSGATTGVSTGSSGTSGSGGINTGPLSGNISVSPIKP